MGLVSDIKERFSNKSNKVKNVSDENAEKDERTNKLLGEAQKYEKTTSKVQQKIAQISKCMERNEYVSDADKEFFHKHVDPDVAITMFQRSKAKEIIEHKVLEDETKNPSIATRNMFLQNLRSNVSNEVEQRDATALEYVRERGIAVGKDKIDDRNIR